MTNDLSVLYQSINFCTRKLGDLMKVKVTECFAKRFALSQNRDPTQSGLKSLETDFLEQALVIGNGIAPLLIVVPNVKIIVSTPVASAIALFILDRAGKDFLS